MHTVLVKYVLPRPVPREQMMAAFKASEPRFRSLPQLIRKYYCYDEANHTGHSVYLWDSAESAHAFFDQDFIDSFEQKFGAVPELFHVDTLMVVDNEAGKTTIG